MEFSNDKGGKGTMAYKTTYPYTNEILATFDNATDEALEEALANGHALYKSGVLKVGLAERKAQLRKIAELLRRDVTNTLKS